MTILDHFDSNGIMADPHNAPIKVFSSFHIISTDIMRFLDPENLCFDTFLITFGVEIGILWMFFDCGIMAARSAT